MTSPARLIVPPAAFALLMGTALVDGYFRDEFYYLACSQRLAWGYVDQPPLSIGILWFVRLVAGDSLLALRMTAALAAAGTIWLTGSIARRLGAAAFGELLAMVTAAIAPGLLAIASFFSMNVFDVLLWTAVARVLIDIADAPSDGRWLLLGVLLGLGLLNKISVLWLGAGVATGLLATPARRLLLTRGPWMAAAVAFLMFLPHVLWQVMYGWPTLEFIRNASRDKMQANGPLSFLLDQVLYLHPLTLPVWGAGLAALLASRRFRRYRLLGVVFVTVAAILILNRTSRSIYLVPAYPMLLAAGATWWESHLRGAAIRSVTLAVLIVLGAVTAPLALPILPVDRYVGYSSALGVAPSTDEKQELGRLPQFFADRQGWDRFVDQVAAAWQRLTPGERQTAAVFTGNYGEAGAIELLGRSRGMRAISGHNNYWLWGPGTASGDALIVLTRNRERLEQQFDRVEQVGVTDCGDCMPYENHLPIFICRGIKTPLPRIWATVKHYE
jgi:hypothetical protein